MPAVTPSNRLHLAAGVALWWAGSAAFSFAARGLAGDSANHVTPAASRLYATSTVLQMAIGMFASVLIDPTAVSTVLRSVAGEAARALRRVRGHGGDAAAGTAAMASPSKRPSPSLLLACGMLGVTHGMGNYLTTAAFGAGSTGVVAVVKACEVVTTVALSVVALRLRVTPAVYRALVIVLAAVVAFSCSGPTHDDIATGAAPAATPQSVVVPVLLAVASNAFLSCRNVVTQTPWWPRDLSSPVATFAVASAVGGLLLLPLMVTDRLPSVAALAHTLPALAVTGVVFAVFSCASFAVLQTVSPVPHAVLGILSRVFVAVAAALWFGPALTLSQLLELAVLCVGTALYYHANTAATSGPPGRRGVRRASGRKRMSPPVGSLPSDDDDDDDGGDEETALLPATPSRHGGTARQRAP